MARSDNGDNGRVGQAAHASRLYGQFSRLYDVVLSRVFVPRVSGVIRALDIPPGSRVLELGVGTGAALSAYPGHCEVVGLDLSLEMLEEAERKVERMGWRHVRVLRGDATNLPFEPDSFDYVNAFHMVTVVDDPDQLMREIVRVCRPGGVVTIVNRFRSDSPALDAMERRMEAVTRRCGWATLSREDVFRAQPLAIRDARHGGPLGLFTTVISENVKA